MEALIAVMIASGPEANRPPHMALAGGVSGALDIWETFGGMMRKILLAVVYTALLTGANPGLAGPEFEGDMKKLALVEPAALPEAVLLDQAEAPRSLADYKGRWVVLNFWATWCPPCRAEMPSLAGLQAAMPEIAVVPVATGRNSVVGIQKFFAEAGIEGLPVLRDPQAELARQMGVLGLPVTLIVDPEGREVARLIGDADWDAPEALAAIRAVMAQ
jgi:thiol-disulfide isomerase/thioredoxin